MRPWYVYLAHRACVCGFWVVGDRRTKTNMMAKDYNLTYNLTIGKRSISLGIKEPVTSY